MSEKDILSFFASYIEKELGIIYADHNYFQLQNRLEEIGKSLGINSVEALYQEAQKGITGKFRQLILDISTNNETSFFRDEKVFWAMKKIVTESLDSFKTDKLCIWSAASSSGQEALSVSIMLNELIEKNNLTLPFEIVGTDISERILNKAREGNYTSFEVQRGLSEALLSKYFTKTPQGDWKASEKLMRNISYSKQNLIEPFKFSRQFNIVLCRNVLIYQKVEAKSEIVRRITETILPGGILILGSGESLLGLSNDYEQIMLEGAVIYRKKII